MPNVITRPPEPGETVLRRTETTTYSHSRAWLPWLLALLLVPLLIALLYLFPFGGRDRVQDALADRADTALAEAQIPGTVSFDGTGANACGVPPGMVEQARQTLQRLSGVGSVTVNDPSCAPVGGPGTIGNALNLSIRNGQVSLAGAVPDEATRVAIVQAAAATGLPVSDQLQVRPGASLPISGTEVGRLAGAMAATPGDRELRFDGSRVTLTGAAATDQDKQSTGDQLKQLAPTLTLDNQLTVADPDAASTLTMAVQNGRMVLGGAVPDEAAKDSLLAAAQASGLAIDDNMTIDPEATMPLAAIDLGRIAGALAASPGDHGVSFDGGNVTLTGSVGTEQDRAGLGEALSQIAPDLTVINSLDVALTGDQAALQQQITTALRQSPITFEPDSPTLTPSGEHAVQQITALMIAAPADTAFEVAGHVAGVTSPQDGLTLSGSRAEAVKQLLVSQGIEADRITAVGYGDTRPIAGNDTLEGQALNRRVEITVRQ